MADFGLAAQIGRGGGAGGVQQVDPANRMMQMMQVQQAQQNMMLQQELAARQRQLFPLQLRQTEQDVEFSGLRGGLVREQIGAAREARLAAERAGSAQAGALDYISRFSGQERLDPKNLDELRRAHPGSYKIIADQIGKARELQAKAQKEGFSAEKARLEMRKVALSGMSSLLPSVTDQNKYAVLYDDFRRIDPEGAKIIGPEFTPENVKTLQTRIRDLSEFEYKEDAFGRPYQLNKRTGQTMLLGSGPTAAQPTAPGVAGGGAALTPVAPALGTQGLSAVEPSMPMSPDVAQRAIAGTAVPSETPGPAPIIGQRQPPAQPALGPKAVAAGQAETAKIAAKRTAEEAKLTQELDTAIREISAVAAPGGLIEQSTGSGIGRAIDAAAGLFGAATPGARAAGRLAPIADLALKLVPRFEGPQSDADVAVYNRAAGQLADTTVPNKIRQDAAKEIVRLMKKRREQFGLRSGPRPQDAGGAALRPIDQEALNWANANLNDPRAAAIKQRLGVQ